jgi:tetratricopeptide (TPR) repeat protein
MNRSIRIIGILALLALICYGQTLTYDFCYDDQKLIVARAADYDKPHILSVIFRAPFWGFSPTRVSQYYRPLVTVTYWLNYHLFDLKPGWYHAFNVGLHALNGILLFGIVMLMSRKNAGLAFFVSALFLAHPIHTASVAWISGRTDLLALFFLLLSYLFFVWFRITTSRWSFLLSPLTGIAYLAGLLSKEAAILFPLLLGLSDGLFLLRSKPGSKIHRIALPYIFCGLALVAYFRMRATALEAAFPSALLGEALSMKSLLRIPSVFTYYVNAMLFPFVYYLHPRWNIPDSWLAPSAWINGLVFAGLAAAFLLCRKTAVRIGLVVFAIFIAPVLYTFLKNNPVNEHWAYLPSAGFAILAGAAIVALGKRRIRGRNLGTVTGVLVLIFYASLCWARNPHFRDNFALYSDGIRKRPDMSLYYINLGEVYEKRGEPEKARALWEKALKVEPGVESANRNIGVLYVKEGNYATAVEYFKKELSLYPEKISTMMDLGRAYLESNQPKKAFPYYEKAVAIDPKFTPVELNKIAVDHYVHGRPDVAVPLWELINQYAPDFAEAYISLGTAFARSNRYAEALAVWQKFLERFPNHPRRYEVTAWIRDVESKAGTR